MKAFLTLTWTETKLMFREPAAVFFTIIFPLMLLVIFGSALGNDVTEGWGPYGAMDVSVPGYFAMIIGTVTLMSVPIVISEYRHNGILRRLRATPLHPFAIIAAHAILNFALAIIGFALLYIGGRILYNLMVPERPLQLIAMITLSYLAFITLGFTIGSLFKSPRTANVVGNVVYFPQLFLSGAAFPREMFSDTMRKWTEWLPMTQVANVIKSSWHGDPLSMTSVAYLAIMMVVLTVFATRIFTWE